VRRHLAAVEAKVDALSVAVTDLRAQSDGAATSSNGRLAGLEAAMREVARGLQMVRDKQELAETHAELSRLSVKVGVRRFKNANPYVRLPCARALELQNTGSTTVRILSSTRVLVLYQHWLTAGSSC